MKLTLSGIAFTLLVQVCAYTACSESSFLYVPSRSACVPPTESGKLTVRPCNMCKALNPENTKEFPLARTKYFTVLLNIFPYGKGHVLIVDNSHGATIDTLAEEKRNELVYVISVTAYAIKEAFKCPGLNIGYNEGYYSGASIPDHLHVHVLPRFDRHEKSFMHAIANTQVVQWDFNAIQQLLLPYFSDITIDSYQKLQD